ncbi:MAG: carbohydrate kinase [Cyanobacteria bacterium P01_H01_bin.15]
MVVAICLGEILFDCLMAAVDDGDSMVSLPGGAPANVACGLSRLGTLTAFVGCIGQDAAGQDLRACMAAEGVNLQGLQQTALAPTRKVQVVHDRSGDRKFGGFISETPRTAAEFADAYLESETLPEDLFQSAQFLVIGSIGLAYPRSQKAVHRALQLAKANKASVFMDINWRSQFWQDPAIAPNCIAEIMEAVNYLKLSEEEAEWLFGSQQASAIAQKLPHLKGVFVTGGGDAPTRYWLNAFAGEIAPFSVATVDTTGAGDGFVAGIIAQLTQRQEELSESVVQDIVCYANAVGALTTLRPGAIASLPQADEVNEFLAAQSQKEQR